MNMHTLKITSQYSLIDYHLQSQLLLLHFVSTKELSDWQVCSIWWGFS